MVDRENHTPWLNLLIPFGGLGDLAAFDELIGEAEGDDRWRFLADEGARLIRAAGHPVTALLFTTHIQRQHGPAAHEALVEAFNAVCDLSVRVDYGVSTPDPEWVQRTVGWTMALRRFADDLTSSGGPDSRSLKLLCGGLELLAVSYDPRQRSRCTTLDDLLTEFSETHPAIAERLRLVMDEGDGEIATNSSISSDQIDTWQKELSRLGEVVENKLVLHQTRGLQLLTRIQLDNIERVLKPLSERLFSDDALTDDLSHSVRALDARALIDRHPLQIAAAGRRISGSARKGTIQLYAEIIDLMRQALRLREDLQSARRGRGSVTNSLTDPIARLEESLRVAGVDAKHCLFVRVLGGQLWRVTTHVPPLPLDVIWMDRATELRWVILFALAEPTTLARFPVEAMRSPASVEGMAALVARLGGHPDSDETETATQLLEIICRDGLFREAQLWLAVFESPNRGLLASTLEQMLTQHRRAVLDELRRMRDLWPLGITDGELVKPFSHRLAQARAYADAGLLALAAAEIAAARLLLRQANEQEQRQREARRTAILSTLAQLSDSLADTPVPVRESLHEVASAIRERLTSDVEESVEIAIEAAVARAATLQSGEAALTSLHALLEPPALHESEDFEFEELTIQENRPDERSEESATDAKSKVRDDADVETTQRHVGPDPVRGSNVPRRSRNDPDSIFASGEVARTSGKLDRAESLFRSVLKVDCGHQRARSQLALVLQTTDRTREAVQVLEEGLELSPSHLPYLNQLAVLCAAIGDLEKARHYAEQGLHRSETPQQEVGFLTQLELVERRRGNREGALQHLSRLIRLRPDASHFRLSYERLKGATANEVLDSALGPELTGELLPWELLPERLEISEFLSEDLRREYVKVPPDFGIKESNEKIVETAVRLYFEAVSSPDRRRPWDEAEKMRTAARLLLDLEKRDPTFDYVKIIRKSRKGSGGENRDEILRRMMSYFASYLGDYHLVHMRMAAARAYFLENFRVYGGLRHFSLSVAEKFIRTWVPEAAQYRSEAQQMVGRDQLRSRDRVRHSPAAVVFQFCLVLEKNWEERRRLPWMSEFLAGFLDVCRVNDAARGALFHFVGKDDHLVRRAMQLLCDTRALNIEAAGPSQWVQEALRRQEALHDKIYQDLKYLRENLIRKARYPEAIQVLGRIGDSCSNATDVQRIERTQNVLRIAERFYSATGFQEKRLLASEMQLAIKGLESEIQKEPTELSRVELGRVLFLTSRDVETEFDGFKRRSLPVLGVQVLRTTQIAPEQVCCDVQIDNFGLSPATDVRIEFKAVDDGRTIGRFELSSVQPGETNASVSKVDLALATLAPGEAIDVDVVGCFADADGNEHLIPGASVRVSLGSRDRIFERIRNPYITGPKVTKKELFKGRDRLIDEILQEVTNQDGPGAVVMYGQKRSGKSSILFWLEQRAPNWVVPVTIDIHSIFANDHSLQTFLFCIADAILVQVSRQCDESFPHIDPTSLLSHPVPTIGFSRFLEQVNDALGLERRLLLLFDEFTDLTANIEKGHIAPGVLRYMKSLIEKGTFSCVLCGIDSMPKVLKTYGNDFAVANTRLVTHLDLESARELVESPIQLEDGTNRFTALASNAIIDLAGSYPFFIQLICHRLVEYLNNEQNPDPTITRADVDQCVRQMVEGQAQFNPWSTFDSLSRYREDDERDTYLTVLEGWLLYLIADEMRASQYVPQEALFRRIGGYASFVSADEVDSILKDLVDRHVLAMPPATPVRQFRLVVELFSRWCAANRPMDEQAMLAFARKLKRLHNNQVIGVDA